MSNIFKENLDIELYNLETDIEEQIDVSSQHLEIVDKIRTIMTQEHEPPINNKFKFKQLGVL